jgi:hypothetical protein
MEPNSKRSGSEQKKKKKKKKNIESYVQTQTDSIELHSLNQFVLRHFRS